MNRKLIFLGILMMLGAVSCGGEGPGLAGARDGSGTGNEEPTETVVEIGSTSGSTFQQNILGVSTSNLSAGGSTTLTVQLRTADGAPYVESADVTFSSDCQSAGVAQIEDPVVTTTTGTATTTYIAQGCSGTDTVTARANVDGQQLVATAALTVAAAELGSIEFVSATPETIGLRGTGAAGIKETAVVKFRVANDVGGPVADQEVEFTLSTDVGGLSLTPATALTGSDGTASVTVRAGTIPTPVSVTATVVGSDIATQSSALTVSTAIPDQDSFSLSASILNPEAWTVDGTEVVLTVLGADRFNNFVPDDTAIIFTTELGAVVAQCLTINGACSATWRAQEPRIDSDNSPTDTGRTTIIAHAIGEEAFQDADGNGVFDGTDPCPAAAGVDCFYDLAEAWRDDNEDEIRDDPSEPFVDFDSDGTYDAANGEWDGIVCGDDGNCQASLISVRDSVTLVMARSSPSFLFFDGAGNALAGTPLLPTTVTICIAGAGTFVPAAPATLADLTQGQPMPAETTISFGADVGTIVGTTAWVVPSTNSQVPDCYTYGINGTDTGKNGLLEVTVTSPGGLTTIGAIPLEDSPEVP
ncbi:MAG TPA: hypothetical protein VF267_08970 [Gammaproteobacteria bacterium]